MRLRFVWVGKTRNPAIRELVAEYLARLEKFVRVEVTELRDAGGAGHDSKRIIEKEGKAVLSRIADDPFVIVLDERGREMDSLEMARLIEERGLAGTAQITFVIGGYAGVDGAVKRRADLVLALSRMTFTHEFARAILIEQLYRAYTIIHGLPYQK
ncbi:MAG: 23S rRNA (pseudouridine(1915)-N(3))-methyltransferase RlmH [Blastocatellia bacterium]|nr:23S rRNA (pseudouridine(1915)-N(3))-methyltransferase RlmH [Blastocatellia bacterium]